MRAMLNIDAIGRTSCDDYNSYGYNYDTRKCKHITAEGKYVMNDTNLMFMNDTSDIDTHIAKQYAHTLRDGYLQYYIWWHLQCPSNSNIVIETKFQKVFNKIALTVGIIFIYYMYTTQQIPFNAIEC